MNSDSKVTTSPLSSMSTPTDPDFKQQIQAICGENVMSCYQCGECTAGCPAAFSMDIAPNQVLRLAQAGFKDDVLTSSAIWLCAGCETCATRCPRGVALSKVMDACRQISVAEGKVAKDQRNVLKMHEEMLRQIQTFGRVHEISMIAAFKMRTGRFFDDVFAGIQMFLKGKLGLIPSVIKGRKEVKELFDKQ
ncbi:MAG: heterodisulfide reductase subunit C [Armatimonadetes bacterium]|nr:heterodisulfide reductase subunit C [Armatimonadota bacterium]